MRLTFLLPGPATRPVGGVRAVYRLAAGMARHGHSATILHPVAWLGSPTAHAGALRRTLSWLKHAALRDYLPRGWLPVDPAVRSRLIPSVSARAVGRAEVLVATGAATMRAAATLPVRCGARVALVQGMEVWDGGRDAVLAAWRLPGQRVLAVSRWLQRELAAAGVASQLVPMAVDHDLFFVELPPEARREPVVAFLGHELGWKGTTDAVATAELVRRAVPSARFELFAAKAVDGVPPWVTRHVDPSPAALRGLYNRAQVFLALSHDEGWDLPACEAMACGAALVASDIPVREEYVVAGENALLVPAGDPAAAARETIRLLEHGEPRLALARRGVAAARELTWERSTRCLDAALARERP